MLQIESSLKHISKNPNSSSLLLGLSITYLKLKKVFCIIIDCVY